MNLNEAIESARKGNFVTNEYFDSEQSLHCYNGKLYYEDGCSITEDFLSKQDFAINGNWEILKSEKDIDKQKLKNLHNRYDKYTLSCGESFHSCFKDILDNSVQELMMQMKLDKKE